MKKIVSFVILCISAPLLAPPRSLNVNTRKAPTFNELLEHFESETPNPAALPAAAKSSIQFVPERPQSQANDDDDGFDATDDLSNTHEIIDQPVQTWMTTLYEGYYKTIHEKCVFQRFCQAIGATRKYNVLMALLGEGKLKIYINELNSANVGTGDSLLNEALREAIRDQETEILIRLLSEDLKYTKILCPETKQAIDIFLQQHNKQTSEDISKQVSNYLERIRLVTQIRNTLGDKKYEGPNLLAMTSAAYAHVAQLTEEVITNTLNVSEKEKPKE